MDWDIYELEIYDEQFWDKPLWRGFTYYVDSESTKIIELGTKAYPYKNIGLPFVEILNYHAHSDHNITVKVKKNTQNLLLKESAYIVNVTQVTIDTYSEDEDDTLSYADIIIKDQDVVMITAKSVFNIMKHTTLRLMTVLNQAEMASGEYNTSMCNFWFTEIL